MTQIEVSEKVFEEFQRLKEEIKNMYNWQELSNDQIMEAMIWGFFDSLEYMKKEQTNQHNHHDCCWGAEDCANKDKWDRCGHHH